jgi:adenylate cyclase
LIEAQIELEKAIALDRNNSLAFNQLGISLIFLGRPETAPPHIENALRLNPRAQNMFYYYYWLGQIQLLLGQADQATDFLRKSRAANPQLWHTHLLLAAALGLRGDINEAKAGLAESIKLKPECNSIAQCVPTLRPICAILRSSRSKKRPYSPVCASPACPKNDRNPPPRRALTFRL